MKKKDQQILFLLTEELKGIWKMDTYGVMSIIIGASAEIPKALKTSLDNLVINPVYMCLYRTL